MDSDGYLELDDDVSRPPYCPLLLLFSADSSRMWLPGAEAGLRWLRRARIETESASWNSYCNVPLGISSFRTHGVSSPLMWGVSSWPIAWVKRHQQAAEMPAWELPSQLVEDIRECFGRLLDGGSNNSPEIMA